MKVTDIIWETDGYEVDLPTEVEVEDGMDEDAICAYLSDTYGWLVIAFRIPIIDDNM